jgi:hypothetical protein
MMSSGNSKSASSTVLALISLVISAISLGVTIFFNFFWHPEDLRMHCAGHLRGGSG